MVIRRYKMLATSISFTILLLIFYLGFGEGVTREHRQNANSEVDQLLSVLRDEQLRRHEPQKVIDAIVRVADLSPQRADVIEALISLLEFKRYYEWEKNRGPDDIVEIHGPLGLGDRYPAIEALGRIGTATVPSLLRVIGENEPESQRNRNALYIFKVLFRGERIEEGRKILLEAAQEANPSSLARQRLTIAMKAYDSHFHLRD